MKHDYTVVDQADPRYPFRLRVLRDAPKRLYMCGRLELVDHITLGVVGSRDCTEYGMETTRWLVGEAARAGAVIVSGMARGIDSVAHESAFEVGGSTIAVFGCGIDRCYPASRRALYDRIMTEGLGISEFPPGTPAYAWNFPHRNRLIAVLSHALLVVEAAAQSGTKSTADAAAAHVDVLAVPGPLGRETSVGTNRLIKEGAEIVTCAEDVLDALKLARAAPEAAAAAGLSQEAQRVRRVLGAEPVHIDKVAEAARLDSATVALALIELELGGYARQRHGNRYARATR